MWFGFYSFYIKEYTLRRPGFLSVYFHTIVDFLTGICTFYMCTLDVSLWVRIYFSFYGIIYEIENRTNASLGGGASGGVCHLYVQYFTYSSLWYRVQWLLYQCLVYIGHKYREYIGYHSSVQTHCPGEEQRMGVLFCYDPLLAFCVGILLRKMCAGGYAWFADNVVWGMRRDGTDVWSTDSFFGYGYCLRY